MQTVELSGFLFVQTVEFSGFWFQRVELLGVLAPNNRIARVFGSNGRVDRFFVCPNGTVFRVLGPTGRVGRGFEFKQ